MHSRADRSTDALRPALPILLLVLLGALFYANSFSVPFVYDDVPAIAGNPSIQRLWPLTAPLSPPPHLTTSGRPLLNFSLAVNYALGGADVRGYHALNLAIHLLAALTLFGLLRRTLVRAPLAARFGASAASLSFVIALLWLLHPLQTESVTYIVQRAESLVGLFLLLTLYTFARAAAAPAPRRWLLLSVVACWLGMATKEVMAAAPLLVLLYDRTFVAGSFRAAWTARRPFYFALAASWLLLAALIASTGGTRDGSAGFGQGMAWWSYALTQTQAIALYLRLSLWPDPLVFDYGNATVPLLAALPYAALLLALLISTFIALRRRSALGFAGVCFFAILAPSSSVVPVVTETLAEHRMYLPLAAVAAVVVLGVFTRLGRATVPLFATLALALGLCTWQRNHDYRDHLALWSDTVAKYPANPRAHNQLASALVAAGREAEALPRYETAVRLAPVDAKARFNLATALARSADPARALEAFATALRLDPRHADAHNNLGHLLLRLGRRDEAVAHFHACLRLSPGFAPAHNNLGVALGSAGELESAVAHFRAALRDQPDYAEAHNNLGFALKSLGQTRAAITHFQTAVALAPRYAEAHNNLALALVAAGRPAESVPHFRAVIRLEPAYTEARDHLRHALAAIAP